MAFGPTPASGGTITLSPSDMLGMHLVPPKNCEPGCLYDAFSLVDDGSLQLLYLANVSDSEQGILQTSYSTTFSNTASDPSDATVTWLSGFTAATCPSCYLAVKDGNNFPSYYFYDLGSWNGTDTLILTGFWPGSGAISHVSVWGTSSPPPSAPIPEPASGVLLGVGLAGVACYRRLRGSRT